MIPSVVRMAAAWIPSQTVRHPAYPAFHPEGAASLHAHLERLQFRRSLRTIHARHPVPWTRTKS
jgi:hypothetical protein